MTVTTTTTPCECCGEPISGTEHFAHDLYPAGAVLCGMCFDDRLISQATGLDMECTRLSPPESVTVGPDGTTVTTATEDGTDSRQVWSGGVVWLGDTEPPDAVKPYIVAGWPPETEQNGDDDE